MKITQYINAEKTIVAADGSGIRQRWLYGLRLLRDPQAMSPGNGNGISVSLRHGMTDALITAAEGRGLKLSAREIRWRIQCARAYRTESQIGNAITDFGTWFALIQAGFPPYPPEPGEPLADHRTRPERDHARAQQMLIQVGPQGTLFPPEFEPTETRLRDLVRYAAEQRAITGRFARRDDDRDAYIGRLLAAVSGNDMAFWSDAKQLVDGELPVG
jgi:hypothetical protein